jgi:FKBP-type peptidyl-prolyl cis-trans isomerase FklB
MFSSLHSPVSCWPPIHVHGPTQSSQDNAASQSAAIKQLQQTQSYAWGMTIASELRKQSLDIDADRFIQGFKDAFFGNKTLLTEAQAGAYAGDMRKESGKRSMKTEKRRQSADAGERFLDENRAKDGVVTLESGLQYKILKAGDGRKPTLSDIVECNYRGTLIDGKEFDSSYKRNQPATFAVNKVIRGWTEALQLMPVGSKWQLFVPANLAYGSRGAGRAVGPDATLIFEVELLAIKEPPPEDASAAMKSQPDTRASASAMTDIKVAFKLDPRLSGPTYGGEHWVSPSIYTGVNAQTTVEARAVGSGYMGQPVNIAPEWTASDPGMVNVSPVQGNAVTIKVLHAGESKLKVASAGVSRELSIKAKDSDGGLQVQIAQ